MALNVALWFAAPGLALRKAIVNQLFGPNMVRAQVHREERAGLEPRPRCHHSGEHHPAHAAGGDGRIQPIPLAGTTKVIHLGRRLPLSALARRWRVVVTGRRSAPAQAVDVEKIPPGQDGLADEPRRCPAYPEAVTAQATGGALLLVEDDDSIGRLVKQYLEQQDGWRVLWLRTGEEAIAELRGQPVRLVVLDIGLPGHRRLRGLPPDPRRLEGADRDAHRPRRGAGSRRRARARRGRLRLEAVLAA